MGTADSAPQPELNWDDVSPPLVIKFDRCGQLFAPGTERGPERVGSLARVHVAFDEDPEGKEGQGTAWDFKRIGLIDRSGTAWNRAANGLSSALAMKPTYSRDAKATPANEDAGKVSLRPSSLANWTPEQIAQGKRWVQAWKQAGEALEKVRREELRRLDPHRAIALLCGPADYRSEPRAPKPSSGLVEQQRWFKKARRP